MFDDSKLYLNTDSALATLAPASTRAHWRSEGRGPPYVKIGPKVAYRGQDLNVWIAAQIVRPGAVPEATGAVA